MEHQNCVSTRIKLKGLPKDAKIYLLPLSEKKQLRKPAYFQENASLAN